ncbi:MAG: hypothetical protein MI974_06315 [Chitinophagales bacterium]|nr:hypothetical protein [Chitinophagales bacterium]
MKIQLMALLALMIIGLGAACNGNTEKAGDAQNTDTAAQQAEEKAWSEMMEIHDAVMPKMADMNRISRELKPYMEEGALEDKSLLEEVNLVLKHLETADEGMMDWMGELQQLKVLRADKDHEAIMAYLEAEKEKITKVQDDMLSSMEHGNKVLEKLSATKE